MFQSSDHSPLGGAQRLRLRHCPTNPIKLKRLAWSLTPHDRLDSVTDNIPKSPGVLPESRGGIP